MHIQHYPGFYMAGIAARTNNATEMSGNGKIGGIWKTLLQPGLVSRIPNKIGVDLIAVYTPTTRPTTPATTPISSVFPLSPTEGMPATLTIKHVSPGNYAVITSGRGPVKEVVRDVWQRIWSMSEEELGGKRAFRCDYEIYDQRSADPENAQIDVYISLR